MRMCGSAQPFHYITTAADFFFVSLAAVADIVAIAVAVCSKRLAF